jgi:hypothetical protein
MKLFEITYPGTWLEIDDFDYRWFVKNVLHGLEQELTESALALFYFEEVDQRMRIELDQWNVKSQERRKKMEQFETEIRNGSQSFGNMRDIVEDESDNQRRCIEKKLSIEMFGTTESSQVPSEQLDELWYRTNQEVARENWQQEIFPKKYQHYIPFLFAKSFLSSVATFQTHLFTLGNDLRTQSRVHDHISQFNIAFPKLRQLRNTVQHVNERLHGRDGRGNRISPEPVYFIAQDPTQEGILVLDQLNDNRYGGTLADGSYGEIEVSARTLLIVNECLQNIIDSYPWKGPKQFYPQ